jgi:hypothetical protein
MRLADFNQQGGWAATAQMNAKLADLGNISVAANMSTPGFGGLEQRIQDRQRETIQGIDASGTIQLGKLLPKKLGLTLPMYLGYSQQVSTPQFDPLSPDIEMAQQEGLSAERRDNAKTIDQLKSINFSSIKIDPQFGDKNGGASRDRNREREGAAAGGRGSLGKEGGSKDAGGKEGARGGSARGGSARGGKSGGGSQIGLLKMLDPGNFTGNFSYIESRRKYRVPTESGVPWRIELQFFTFPQKFQAIWEDWIFAQVGIHEVADRLQFLPRAEAI